MLLTKFQASEPSGSEEDFFLIFSMYNNNFYGSNLGPPSGGHLEPGDLHMNKLGKRPLSNATYKISSI